MRTKPTRKQLDTFNKMLVHGPGTILVEEDGRWMAKAEDGHTFDVNRATARAMIDKRMAQPNWVDERGGYLCCSPDANQVECGDLRAWHQEWEITEGYFRVEGVPDAIIIRVDKVERHEITNYATGKETTRTDTYLTVIFQFRNLECEAWSCVPVYGKTWRGAIKHVLKILSEDYEWLFRNAMMQLEGMARATGASNFDLMEARAPGGWRTASNSEWIGNLCRLIEERQAAKACA